MSKSFFEDGKRFDAYYMAPEDIVIIGLDTKDGSDHFLYDERIKLPLAGSFVDNVMKVGVIKAITCTKLVIDGMERAVVVDGRQRVRAARKANELLVKQGEQAMRIKVIPQRGAEDMLMVVGVSTNSFVQEDTPVLKARKAQRLLDRGLSTAEVASSMGVTTQSVANWTKLLELDKTVLKAVDSEQIAASTAIQLHGLDKSAQADKLKELLDSSKNGKRPTAKKAARAVASPAARVAPGKRLARKLVQSHVEGTTDFVSEDFLHGVQWAIGDITDEDIKGMRKFIESLD
jgi:ParB family chromosome partitioning protein